MGRVVVVGSINMDIVATAARLPAPGETVAGDDLRRFPGGKGANQAVAAARAGAPTAMVGAVGADAAGAELAAFLAAAGVDTTAVDVVSGVTSGTAVIVVDADGENVIVVIPGANAYLAPSDVDRAHVAPGDVVVVQFEVPPATVVAALRHARAHGATTILNPAPFREIDADLAALVDVLVLNEHELATASGCALTVTSSTAALGVAVAQLPRPLGATTVVTLGARGAVAFTADRAFEVPGIATAAVDATGAGDCFVGVLAARIAAGDPLDQALARANTAAAICVERPGAGPSMPTAAEIEARALDA